MPEVSMPYPDRPMTLVQAKVDETLEAIRAPLIVELLRNTAVLVRDYPPDIATFNAFAKKFCAVSVFNESPNRLVLDNENNIQSVNLGAEPFPLHPELSREPWKPDLCFFHCIEAPRQGGETTYCDGVELWRRLPETVRAALENRSLLYVQPAPPAIMEYWLGTAQPDEFTLSNPPAHCPYRFRRFGENVVRYFTYPAVHRTLLSDDFAFGNFLLFARHYLHNDRIPLFEDGYIVPDWIVDAITQAAAPITYAVPWRPGDILILDNSRFMHGRNAINEPADRLIASYFGYLDGVGQRPDEIANPPWRQPGFRPPGPQQRPHVP
jgi:alpha-ketoglutarate-dependent taurine dioxygenase